MNYVGTYLMVVAVGELEVEGDARVGLAGGDHVVGVLHLPGGEGGHLMAVVHLGSSSRIRDRNTRRMYGQGEGALEGGVGTEGTTGKLP